MDSGSGHFCKTPNPAAGCGVVVGAFLISGASPVPAVALPV